ncbi:MAG: hypothetical protein ABEK10_00470 [Candidatus Nanosalina sp.]
MTERISSDRAIELVDRHRESIEGFVKRHSLDRYQVNKLIKAETALRNRNSVLNLLRKEKDKIEMKEEREQALEEDVKNHVEETGSGRIGDLKDDIVEIREQMTEIVGNDKPSFEEPNHSTQIKRPENEENKSIEENNHEEPSGQEPGDEETREIEDKDSKKFEGSVIPDELTGTKTGGSISSDEKSRGKLQREVNSYFAGLPSDEELDGIASNFKNLLPEEKRENLSGNAVSPVDMFEDLRGKSKREKAVKSAYAVKKAFERNKRSHISYREISEELKNMDVVRKPLDTSEFFSYMQNYDGMSQIGFEDVSSAVHDCKRIVKELENS